jgi:hypothetical protein
MREVGPLVEVLGDVVPWRQPVVAHVLPGLVVVPPARGTKSAPYLETGKKEMLNRAASVTKFRPLEKIT